MEIAPAPSRRLSRGVTAAALLLVVLSLTFLVALPALLGAQQYVVDDGDMQATDRGETAGIAPGSLLFATVVPTSDLAVGDVVTYAPPEGSGAGDVVTRRVVAVHDGTVITRGDGLRDTDPWRLRSAERPTTSRVVVSIPVLGRLLSPPTPRAAWFLLGLPALLVAAGLLREQQLRRRALRRHGPIRTVTPVGGVTA